MLLGNSTVCSFIFLFFYLCQTLVHFILYYKGEWMYHNMVGKPLPLRWKNNFICWIKMIIYQQQQQVSRIPPCIYIHLTQSPATHTGFTVHSGRPRLMCGKAQGSWRPFIFSRKRLTARGKMERGESAVAVFSVCISGRTERGKCQSVHAGTPHSHPYPHSRTPASTNTHSHREAMPHTLTHSHIAKHCHPPTHTYP